MFGLTCAFIKVHYFLLAYLFYHCFFIFRVYVHSCTVCLQREFILKVDLQSADRTAEFKIIDWELLPTGP